jgi:Periplasmic copper-binding protein (NosD)
MTSPRRTLTIMLVLAGATLTVPVSASAQVACGDVITEDTVLHEDVVCGEGEAVPAPDGGWEEYAILVGADGVTLNLNGHRATGPWSGVGIGVYGHREVTVRNGSTPHVSLRDTTNSRLIGMRTEFVDLKRSGHNLLTGGEGGISLWQSTDNVIEVNRVVSEGGLNLTQGSDRNAVRRNTLCAGMGYPLFVDASDDNLIEKNTVPASVPDWGEANCSGLSEDGILVREATSGNRVLGNTVTGMTGDGIRVESRAAKVAGNTSTRNGDLGIEAVAGVESGVNYARGNGNPLQCLNVICLSETPAPAPQPQPGPPRGTGGKPPLPLDITPPLVSLAGKSIQRLGRTIWLTVGAPGESLWVSLSGRVRVSGTARRHRLAATRSRLVSPGGKSRLALRVPRPTRKAMRLALDRGKRVKVVLSVLVRDMAGNDSTLRRTIKITR